MINVIYQLFILCKLNDISSNIINGHETLTEGGELVSKSDSLNVRYLLISHRVHFMYAKRGIFPSPTNTSYLLEQHSDLWRG